MKKNHSSRVWFVYSCDSHTNRSVFLELNANAESDCVVEDIDFQGQKTRKNLNLAQLHSYDEVQLLKRSKKQLSLKFKIFIQDDPGGKIYRWPFDEGIQSKSKKAKSC